jgi:hypothetical protein
MWKMKNREIPVTENADALEIQRKLLALKAIVPSLKNIEVGLNDKAADANNHDIILVTDFADFAGLKEYATHPEHVKVGVLIREVTEGRVCVDYQY